MDNSKALAPKHSTSGCGGIELANWPPPHGWCYRMRSPCRLGDRRIPHPSCAQARDRHPFRHLLYIASRALGRGTLILGVQSILRRLPRSFPLLFLFYLLPSPSNFRLLLPPASESHTSPLSLRLPTHLGQPTILDDSALTLGLASIHQFPLPRRRISPLITYASAHVVAPPSPANQTNPSIVINSPPCSPPTEPPIDICAHLDGRLVLS